LQDVIEKEKLAEAQIRQFIDERGHDLAAIIIEPIQGEGGDNHFRGQWLRLLRKICNENDMLLILDEVQTGMGVTGTNWCCQHFDVLPDLLVFGKKAQVCGVMAGPRLDEVKDNVFRLPSRINSTWGANFCDFVRSTHYLRIIEREKLIENACVQGIRLSDGLREIATRHPSVSGVRGRGLLIAFDLPNRAMLRDQFWTGAYELGLLVLRCGERSIRLRPVWMSKTKSLTPHWCSLRLDASGSVFDMKKRAPSPPAILKKLGLRADNPGVFAANGSAADPSSRAFLLSTAKFSPPCTATAADYEQTMHRAAAAFANWQSVPAPKRGELIRQFGNALRDGQSGPRKIGHAGSRKNPGRRRRRSAGNDRHLRFRRRPFPPALRPDHALGTPRPPHVEQWHPLGIVGIISAFNFPVAVWAWNSALAIVCGDATLWKSSEQTPLCAIATIKIAERVCRDQGVDPALFSLAIGGREDVGEKMALDKRLPLISATGSTNMGRDVGEKVQRRLGRALLELGGNNAIIVAASADLDLATRAILFGAVGTAGQRCTSTRRVFVHRSLEKELTKRSGRLSPSADRQSAGTRYANGAADQRDRSGSHATSLAPVARGRRGNSVWRRALRAKNFPAAVTSTMPGQGRAALQNRARGNVRPILYLMPYEKIGGRHRLAQRRAARIKLRHLHQRPARGGIFPFQPRQRLRHCQREHRHQRGGNRRRFWRRERNRRRPGKRQRRLEKLHAPPNRDHQLFRPIAAGPRHQFSPAVPVLPMSILPLSLFTKL
jgi:hypothetical protein